MRRYGAGALIELQHDDDDAKSILGFLIRAGRARRRRHALICTCAQRERATRLMPP